MGGRRARRSKHVWQTDGKNQHPVRNKTDPEHRKTPARQTEKVWDKSSMLAGGREGRRDEQKTRLKHQLHAEVVLEASEVTAKYSKTNK